MNSDLAVRKAQNVATHRRQYKKLERQDKKARISAT